MSFHDGMPSKEDLKKKYVGKSIKDVELSLPAAVLDIAAIKRNMDRMSDAISLLGDVRIAVSSHKMTEVVKLHIGEPIPGLVVRLMVETMSDAENVFPMILEYQLKGVQFNVLYGSLVTPSILDRLAAFNKVLTTAGGSLSVLIDHPLQIPLLQHVYVKSGCPMYAYILLDSGDRVSGLDPAHEDFRAVFSELERIATSEDPTSIDFLGFHTTMRYNLIDYDAREALTALDKQLHVTRSASPLKHLKLSITPSPILPQLAAHLAYEHHPQAMAHQNACHNSIIQKIREFSQSIEIVTDLLFGLDCFELGTHTASPDEKGPLNFNDIPLTVLTEVSSIYKERGNRREPEVLLSAGASALGEKGLLGGTMLRYGILSQWNMQNPTRMTRKGGWQVLRAGEEESVLGWTAKEGLMMQLLFVGQRVRVYPWHARQALRRVDWVLVVDESRVGKGDEVVDIWVRWRD